MVKAVAKDRRDQLARQEQARYELENERRRPLVQGTLLAAFGVAAPPNRARSNSLVSGRDIRREAEGNETPSSSSSSLSSSSAAMSMSSESDKSQGNSNNMDVSSNNGTTARDTRGIPLRRLLINDSENEMSISGDANLSENDADEEYVGDEVDDANLSSSVPSTTLDRTVEERRKYESDGPEDDGITAPSGIVRDAPDAIVTDAGTAASAVNGGDDYKMMPDYSTFLTDNADLFNTNEFLRDNTQLRFPCPKGLHPSFLLSFRVIRKNKQVKAMEWMETIRECPYCTYQLDETLSKVDFDKQLNEKKKKATRELITSTGLYGEYIYNYYMFHQRFMDVDNRRDAGVGVNQGGDDEDGVDHHLDDAEDEEEGVALLVAAAAAVGIIDDVGAAAVAVATTSAASSSLSSPTSTTDAGITARSPSSSSHSAYQHHMAFENARPDAVFAINTDLTTRFFWMNIQIKCTTSYRGYGLYDDQSFIDLIQQQDYLLVTIQRPKNSDIADEPVQILVGFVHEYRLRQKSGKIKKKKNPLLGYLPMIYFDDNKHLEVPHTLLFHTVVKKYIRFLFKAMSKQVQCESDLHLAIAPWHTSGKVEYKNYRETFKHGRVKDSENKFLYYYVFNPTKSLYDNDIIVQVKNESAHKVQDKFLAYCCYCCNKYNRRSKEDQRTIGGDNSYKCNSCHHFTIVNDDKDIFVIVKDQSKTNADLIPSSGLYKPEDFDVVRMVVGNDSYFVPTSQLPTNKDSFIKKVRGQNSRKSKRESAHVCHFSSSYKLTIRNKIEMPIICEIVGVEDKTNPLLPSDFISFEPRQEIPPAVVTYDNIQNTIR